MVWAAVGIAAAGLIINVATQASAESPGTPSSTGQSSTKLEFPKETRELFQNVEEPLLQSSQQQLQSQLSPLLGGFQTRDQAQQKLGTARAGSMALSAAKHAGAGSGITDFGPIEDSLQGLSPQLLASLKQLVLQRGAHINTVVPPGYGPFFNPSSSSSSTSTQAGASPYATGFGIAQGIGNVAGAYFNNVKNTPATAPAPVVAPVAPIT